MFKRLLVLVVCLATGCAIKEPPYGKLNPVYSLPTMSLDDKAKLLEQRIVEDHLNNEGYLLYAVQLPLAENYADGHSSADLPSWHGHWMMALAFKQAVEPSDKNLDLIHRSIVGLRTNFDATGVRGLLARSYLKHDGPALPWMEHYNEKDYPTKHWRKGKNGYWFRTGVAKGHYESAVLGLAALKGLDRQGKITLPEETRLLVDETIKDLVLYLVSNGYNIVDYDGEPTEYGKLSDWRYNGQTAIQVVGMLSACRATGNLVCAHEYYTMVDHWATGVSISLYGNGARNLFGYVTGPLFKLYKPNDTIHAISGVLMHELTSDKGDAVQSLRGKKLMKRLSALSGRDRNPYFNYIYEVTNGYDEQKRLDSLLTLQMFPDDKRQVEPLDVDEESDEIHPIANLRINSHYWKTSWNESAKLTPDSKRTNLEYSGQDYLGAYWMGRYYGFISKEEAEAEVHW